MDTSNEIISHARRLIDSLDKVAEKKTKAEADKIDRCVEDIENKEDVDNPWAVCTASVMGKADKDIYNKNIESETVNNDNFRKVVFTGEHLQLVYMSLKPGEDIGMEKHDVDQFFRFESGTGYVMVGDNKHDVKDGSGVVIPAGTEHNIVNASDEEPLKLYTIYAPPQHPEGTVLKDKKKDE